MVSSLRLSHRQEEGLLHLFQKMKRKEAWGGMLQIMVQEVVGTIKKYL